MLTQCIQEKNKPFRKNRLIRLIQVSREKYAASLKRGQIGCSSPVETLR